MEGGGAVKGAEEGEGGEEGEEAGGEVNGGVGVGCLPGETCCPCSCSRHIPISPSILIPPSGCKAFFASIVHIAA